MGRIVPNGDININISLIGSFLYISFSFVASIAIIAALCSVQFRRKKKPPPQPVPYTLSINPTPIEVTKALNLNHVSTTPPTTEEHPRTQEAEENNDGLVKELPLPPAMQQLPNNINNSEIMKRATSERRLSFNLSMKMPRSLSMAKNKDHHQKEESSDTKKENNKVKKGDESVWMKTIILGEKCVPDEEEDGVIYEGKGKKISAYHPRKSTSSMSLSRQWSSIAVDALSVPQPQSHEERIDNI